MRLFRKLAGDLGAERVALGHNADDQAETVLLRMLRGAGLRGLAGMPHIRERFFVRPLLSISRQEILSYLKSADCPIGPTPAMPSPSIFVIVCVMNCFRSCNHWLLRQSGYWRARPISCGMMTVSWTLWLPARLKRIIRSHDSATLMLDRAALLEQPVALQRRMLRQALQALLPSSGAPRSDQLMSLLASLTSSRSGGAWKVGAVSVACEHDQLRMTIASPPSEGARDAIAVESGSVTLLVRRVDDYFLAINGFVALDRAVDPYPGGDL